MKRTVLVCALTCLLIAPHAYAEGDSGVRIDWIAMVALAVSLLSALLAWLQMREVRRTYQAQAFLDMSKQMRHFRPVRTMMNKALELSGGELADADEERELRDYLGYLNDSAFLSETRYGRRIIPRDWILELWASAITKTWPVAWRYIEKWRGTEAMGSRLYHQYEQLARECCASRLSTDPLARQVWLECFEDGPQRAKDSQAGS